MTELKSFKELYDVFLKTTYLIDEGDVRFEKGETIARFERIQIAGLEELKHRTESRGGFDNRGHVFWETTKEMDLAFTQGVFSELQFALMSNSNLISKGEGSPILITKQELLESGEDGTFSLTKEPQGSVFIYNKETGEKLEYTQDGKIITIGEKFLDVVVNYEYNYLGGGRNVKIGQRLISGFLSLEGKTRVKDDTSGQVTTGLIKIPRLKLVSDLSIRLGKQAKPITASFLAKGIPTGGRGDSYVSEFYFLNDDVDSDL